MPGLLDTSGIGEQIQFMIHFTEAFESAFKPISAGESKGVVSLAESPSESLMLAGIPGLRKADFGTRFVVNFANVPQGVSIFVTTEPMLAGMKRSDSIDARLVGFDARGAQRSQEIPPSGVASCGAAGLGVAQLPLEKGSGAAVWRLPPRIPTFWKKSASALQSHFALIARACGNRDSHGERDPGSNATRQH